MTDNSKPFDEWAIVDIMGHQRYAGRVTEQTIAGGSLLRIDIPTTPKQAGYSKLFGIGSVYALTPTTEAIATAMAETLSNSPMTVYDLPASWQEKLRAPAPVRSLPSPFPSDDLDDDYDDEENDDQ